MEINEKENGDFIYSYTQKVLTQIVNKKDEETLKAIYRYCEENNIEPSIIDEDKLKIILQLGIAEYNKRFGE
jgi:hypothetical protein